MLGPNPTGLGVYSVRCAAAISSHFDPLVIASPGTRESVNTLAVAPSRVAIGSGKLAALRRQLWLRSLDIGKNRIVYSPTHHGPPGVTGQIITIHDLIALRYPRQHRSQYLFFKHFLPKLLSRCAAVFTVSETTRADVIDNFRFPGDRIFVVPNGVERFESGVIRDIGEGYGRPFLLMVGARYPHKNVHEVIERWSCWSDKYRLVVVSAADDYRRSLEVMAGRYGVRHRIVFLDYVARDQLITLYRNASALVYPSLWEGFGIPPLEALECGTPVIASDIPVHREVLADSAIFVRIGDKDSWSLAFDSLEGLTSQSEWQLRRQRVLDRYTWGASEQKLVRSLLTVEPRLRLRDDRKLLRLSDSSVNS
jgi:glycosyltransferase involved in cell wall biosynthesis